MEQRTHFFFAVKMPNETKLRMKEHINTLRETLLFNRWVHHMDLHITLAFLGTAQPEKLMAAEKFVREAISDSKEFTLKINQLGTFGSETNPRVLWADTEDCDELRILRKKVFSACDSAGFQLETRPFRPHITLARKWAGVSPFRQEQLEIWKKLQPEPMPFQADEVVLYQTHLNKSPKYEAIQSFPLKI